MTSGRHWMPEKKCWIHASGIIRAVSYQCTGAAGRFGRIRSRAEAWLEKNSQQLGVRSSFNLAKLFG